MNKVTFASITIFFFLVAVPLAAQVMERRSPDFPFKIVESRAPGVRADGFQKLYVLIDEKCFNRTNLEHLFSHLGGTQKIVNISVYTDETEVKEFINFEKKPVPYFSNTKQGEQARNEFFEKNYPVPRGLSAHYSKNPKREFYRYTLSKKRGGWSVVTLKDSVTREQTPEFILNAVKAGSRDRVRWYVERSKTVNVVDEHGNTPLLIAASFGHIEILRDLLLAGADPNHRGPEGFSSLRNAVEIGNFEAVSLLLEMKADVNLADTSGLTPLMMAAAECNKEIVRVLLQNGASVNERDSTGKLAFDWACHDSELQKMLISK